MASDIIIRLNGIRDEKYATKIAYETFRTIGRVYERKYQKDVNDSMDILTPLLNITDGVFTEISKNIKIMNKSVKNGFFHAYRETNALEFLEELDGHQLDKAIDWLNQPPNPNDSPLDCMIEDIEEITKSEWVKNQDASEMELTALAITKHKLMQQLDWLYCSFDKEVLNDFNKIEKTTTEVENITKDSKYK